MDDFLARQPRTQSGPAFNPRTGGFTPQQPGQHTNLGRPTGRSGGLASIPTPTRTGDDRGSLEHQVRRMEAYRVGQLRQGYYHYDPFWRDWHFGYGYYAFHPVPYQSVFSIYYGYWTCPPYLWYNRIFWRPYTIIVILDPYRWTYCGRGHIYNTYYTTTTWRSAYSPIDRVLSDLTDAFRYADPTLLDRYLPRSGEVEVFIDGQYSYAMRADDYYDITADMIYSVYTTGFDLLDVRRTRSGGYYVVARHEFVDAWNTRQTNYLTFTFDNVRGSYVITQAGSSQQRPRY